MIDQSEYAIVVLKLSDDDGGGFIGFVPDLPGCMSDGETQDEALRNTVEAVGEWIETQLERGIELPVPGAASEAARIREGKLKDAIASLAEYNRDADEQIAVLERKLTELIAVLRADDGGIPSKFTAFQVAPKIQKKIAH